MLQDLKIGEDFCGHKINSPLGGSEPIVAEPALVFGTRLTAVAATSTGDTRRLPLHSQRPSQEGMLICKDLVSISTAEYFKALRDRITSQGCILGPHDKNAAFIPSDMRICPVPNTSLKHKHTNKN
jgi:hypothetical protein